MNDEYVVPVMKKVGSSEELILGSTCIGNDILDQILVPEFEFEAD